MQKAHWTLNLFDLSCLKMDQTWCVICLLDFSIQKIVFYEEK